MIITVFKCHFLYNLKKNRCEDLFQTTPLHRQHVSSFSVQMEPWLFYIMIDQESCEQTTEETAHSSYTLLLSWEKRIVKCFISEVKDSGVVSKLKIWSASDLSVPTINYLMYLINILTDFLAKMMLQIIMNAEWRHGLLRSFDQWNIKRHVWLSCELSVYLKIWFKLIATVLLPCRTMFYAI